MKTSVPNREESDRWATRDLRASKASRWVACLQWLASFCTLVGSLTACLRVPLQGVKGGLGDPGLPGPTGIRGEFGDRVSSTHHF